jgi:hemoglobin-like flavoprotein
VRRFDAVDAIAALMLTSGIALMAWGVHLRPPGSLEELVLTHFGDWTPGLAIDGVLVLVINQVIHTHERKRIINQVASLSNEFALDAVRRSREEGWLLNGTMENGRFGKARLATADLSGGRLAGSEFGFADLTRVDFAHADLRGATFRGANLSDADLRWSNLSGADLRWADLRGAQLDGANLEGAHADFASVDTEQADREEFGRAVVGGFLSVHQVDLVGASFSSLMKLGEAPIARFYRRLFQVEPGLRSLFSEDIDRQARKFLQSLKLIVSALSSVEKAAPVLERLGERHRGYGVEPSHYDVVGRVLVETFEASLGEEFTPEMRGAWEAAFGLIASLMRGQPA